MAGKRSRKDVKNTRQKRLENIVEDKELRSLASASKVMPTQDYCTKPSSHSRKRFLLNPDISSILKEDDTVQDENYSCYEHPLHSTAVSIAESSEDSEEKNLNEDKNTKKQDRSHTSEASEEKKKKSQSSENITSHPNIVRSFPEEAVLQTQKGKKRKKSPQVIELESSEAEGCSSTKTSHPEHLRYSSKRLTGLEVILREFEKIATEYKETMGLDVCNNAIEKLTIHFKEQLTETVSQVHDLKNLEKKNRQVIAAITKKSKELVEMKGEQLK
ncbi:uncharacterized protein LOC122816213 [Protopterus annectens]|uniref:uncharacterized protein LOC122816213 n=1 Tax=Protopterus annectens TaxID=7888 RepID=UPI001CFA8E72|nr:uncharacterized protein LOC122816213 [Protopterus annectens]